MHSNTKWLIEWADRMNKKFGPPESGYDWCRKLAYAMNEAGNNDPSPEAIALAVKWENSKFGNTYCSQCGEEFGPGDHGYSHCKDHRNTAKEIEQMATKLNNINKRFYRRNI